MQSMRSSTLTSPLRHFLLDLAIFRRLKTLMSWIGGSFAVKKQLLHQHPKAELSGWDLQVAGEEKGATGPTVMEILTTATAIIMAVDILRLLMADIATAYLLLHLKKSADQLGHDLAMTIGQILDFRPGHHLQQITAGTMAQETVVEMAIAETATDQHLVTLIGRQEVEADLRISTHIYRVTVLTAVDLQGKEMTDHHEMTE